MKISYKIVSFAILLLMVFFSNGIYAQSVDFKYNSVDEILKYKNQIWMENITDTGVIYVTTNFGISSWLENEITEKDDNLLLKMTYTDIKLDFYKRELKILNKESRSVGLNDKEKLETELREQSLYKWTNLIVSPEGKILEKYQSFALTGVSLIDLSQTAEQFFILFPDEEIQIGHQWEEKYSSTMPPYDQGQPFVGTTKYTYLGQEEHNGILSNKVKAVLFVEEERKNGEGCLTRISRLGTGIIYLSVNGNYLVESTISSDLSLLVMEDGESERSYRNFIRTRFDQNIELVQDDID
ncbi:MAG: hypothetical protein KAX49_07465 [Halanaerobiales bacterium]|nr:hypothetical protein [Halanaerobiales bacterium]